MSNPFDGLINDAFKTAFDNAIDAVIDGCEAPCKLVYPSTKYVACDSCEGSNLGRKGPNPYLPGGDGRHAGTCSKCQGERKIPVPNEEIIDLVVIWDHKQFTPIAGMVKYPEGSIQTMSSIDKLEKIKNCMHMYANTSIENLANYKYTRDGEPTPIGFTLDEGANRGYVITLWKKS